MENSAIFTVRLLQILFLPYVIGLRVSQEKCEFYHKFQSTDKRFPFLVSVYNNGDYSYDGVLISENFVLTTANNGKFIRPVVSNQQQFDVIEEISNEKGNLWLLKLGKSIDFNNGIRPVCLPQPESVITPQLTEVCWADGSWLNEIKLINLSNSSCDENSVGYKKNIRIQGVDYEVTVCALVKSGDGDRCNRPGAALLIDHQEILGIASESTNRNLQIFIRLSEHLSWIEMVVWPDEITTTEKLLTSPSENDSTTTDKTPTPDVEIALSQIADELHDIHVFLNVNLILIVIMLLLVLCIACILWSDGLCIRAVLSDHCSKSTTV